MAPAQRQMMPRVASKDRNMPQIHAHAGEVAMAKADAVFTGSIPALYDKYLGPMIFQPYADDTAQRLSWLKQGRVLELAAGTGIVTQALIKALPETVSLVATDLNQAMIDVAAIKDMTGRVSWQQVDAQALPFPDGSFDAVVCQFGVMFFPDKPKAFREARRVLKPGGRYLFNVWDSLAYNEVTDLVVSAVAEMFPNDPPQFLARTPHGHHDKAPIVSALRAAGFTDVAAETVTKRGKAANATDAVFGFVQGTPHRSEIEARDATRLAEATEKAAARVKAKFGDGSIDGKIQAIVFTARR
jgi:ubiquinone/menaquinone biosynthesis C-methylase UbiE